MKNPLFLLFLLSLASPVSANKIADLYEAEVAVEDQLAGHRETAVRTAMRAVLVKVTGDRFAPQRTSLLPVIEKAGDYMQQYRYIRVAAKTMPGAQESGTQLKLRVKFDETTLNNALRNLGVPVWGRERPTTLVWVAVQDESGRRLISLEQDPEYIRILDERARRRGIVLIFPLMDLQDTSSLGVSDVWGGFSQPVLDASARYQADTVLVGKVASSPAGIWEASWTSHIEGTTSRWTAEGSLPEAVLDEGVDGQADLLASQFVGSRGSTQTEKISIVVNDITGADQYTRVLKYLRSLSSVTNVQVERVVPGHVRFAVTVHGGEFVIKQAIALGRVMEPVQDDNNENNYRLLP